MKTIIYFLTFMCSCICVAQTNYYEVDKTFYKNGYTYQCDIHEGSKMVTLYNKENQYTYVDQIINNGTQPPMENMPRCIEKDNWTKVRLESNSSVSGWINNSSLTKKKIVLSTNKVSVSTNELALAGKGFNAEIEAEYKKNGKVNYAAVDRLEKNLVSFDTVFEFMEAGKLLYQNLMNQLQGER